MSHPFPRDLALRTAACLVVIAAWTGGTGAQEPEGPGQARGAPPRIGELETLPNVLLITIDTLQRDHVGAYGYFRDTTPNLDALAEGAILFEEALATMATTLPSHLSILTGLYPHQHGVSSNRDGARDPFETGPGRLSIAQVLQANGYETAAVVGSMPLAPRSGIGAGFDTFCYPPRRARDMNTTERRMVAAEVAAEALSWLAERKADGPPFFLWVHFWDLHEPNHPPSEYAEAFTTDAAMEAWIDARGFDVEELTERYGQMRRAIQDYLGVQLLPRVRRMVREGVTLGPIWLADIANRYDADLANVDARIGEILAALGKAGIRERTVVAVAGAHGQSLGEDDWLGQGRLTHRNLAVPLILDLPDSLEAPARVERRVSLVDLVPTLLGRIPLEDDAGFAERAEGQDVFSGAFRRTHVLAQRTSEAIADGEEGPLWVLFDGAWKYAHRPEGKDELFDLEGAGEFTDVAGEHPKVASRLRAIVLETLSRRRFAPGESEPGESEPGGSEEGEREEGEPQEEGADSAVGGE